MAARRRPRPVPGGFLVAFAALIWSIPVFGIPFAIVGRLSAPNPEPTLPWGLDFVVYFVVAIAIALGFWFVGLLFWRPGRRRIDEHTRMLLEERRADGA